MVSRTNRESVGVWIRYLQPRPLDAAQVRSRAVHTLPLLTQSRAKLWQGFHILQSGPQTLTIALKRSIAESLHPRMLVCPEREGLKEDVRPLYVRAFKLPRGSLLVLVHPRPRVDAAGRDPGSFKAAAETNSALEERRDSWRMSKIFYLMNHGSSSPIVSK